MTDGQLRTLHCRKGGQQTIVYIFIQIVELMEEFALIVCRPQHSDGEHT